MKKATYVYCVVKRNRAPSLARVPAGMPRGARPRTVEGPRGTWLIVSEVPLNAYGTDAINTGLKDMAWVSARAMAHEAVVEFCARTADVIPMKLFTIFRDDERAVSHVGSAARLGPIFRRIAGCTEWSVRVNCVPSAAPGTHARRSRSASREAKGSGTAFLQRKKAHRDEVRAAADLARQVVENVHARLARIAKAAVRKEGDVPGTNLMLDAAFLVSRKKERTFQRELQRLSGRAAAAGCDVVLSGPWPPYHFVAEA